LAGYYHWNQGRGEKARSLAEEAMRDGIVAGTLNPLEPHGAAVVFEMAAGNHARALEIVEQIHAALNTIDDPFVESYARSGIASFQAMAGRTDQARADADRALELARRIQNQFLLLSSYHATAWAYQRDDPGTALAASEEFLRIYRATDIDPRSAGSLLALAGGLRARLGDDTGALDHLHEAVLLDRDQGTRPQLAGALDWALSPLLRTGQPDVAATLLGALTRGVLAQVSNFPGVNAARTRTLERLRGALGDAKTDELVSRGEAMSYDELVDYALHHLDRPDGNRD
jgi:tetratricopeptide (TPR) repeat protein